MKILIADDEREIRTVLKLLLENKGYSVVEASNGAEAISAMQADRGIDLCIMDIMMPEVNGLGAVRKIREFSAVPILFLTARSLDDDKTQAYGVGGDDYIVKPFSPSELLLKVEALTRRYNMYSQKNDDSSDIIKISSGVIISVAARQVQKDGINIEMRDKEFEVLTYLAQNKGRAISTDELYREVWGEIPLNSSANTVTVHILNLRRKLEGSSSLKIIRTVWGKGYQID